MNNGSKPIVVVSSKGRKIDIPTGQTIGPSEDMRLKTQSFIPIVDGEAYTTINMNGFKFASEEWKQRFNEEVDTLKKQHQKYPDNFDDPSRNDLKKQIEDLIDQWLDMRRIVPL